MAQPRTIDLNADLGEGFPWDEPLLGLITSASVCCGAHAGDPGAIRATLATAAARGVVVGAHPGFADREGFGRRERPVDAAGAERIVREQVGALEALARPLGVAIRFLKPHGALYNQAQRSEQVAAGVVAAAEGLGLPILGLPCGRVEAQARRRGVPFLVEGFPDRRYLPDGRLAPRSEPSAVLHDPEAAAAQAVRLAMSGVATLCIHGDEPTAVELAGAIRDALRGAGIDLASFAPPSRA